MTKYILATHLQIIKILLTCVSIIKMEINKPSWETCSTTSFYSFVIGKKLILSVSRTTSHVTGHNSLIMTVGNMTWPTYLSIKYKYKIIFLSNCIHLILIDWSFVSIHTDLYEHTGTWSTMHSNYIQYLYSTLSLNQPKLYEMRNQN